MNMRLSAPQVAVYMKAAWAEVRFTANVVPVSKAWGGANGRACR